MLSTLNAPTLPVIAAHLHLHCVHALTWLTRTSKVSSAYELNALMKSVAVVQWLLQSRLHCLLALTGLVDLMCLEDLDHAEHSLSHSLDRYQACD